MKLTNKCLFNKLNIFSKTEIKKLGKNYTEHRNFSNQTCKPLSTFCKLQRTLRKTHFTKRNFLGEHLKKKILSTKRIQQ